MQEGWLTIMLAAVFEYSIQRTRVGIGKQPRGLCKNTRAQWRWHGWWQWGGDKWSDCWCVYRKGWHNCPMEGIWGMTGQRSHEPRWKRKRHAPFRGRGKSKSSTLDMLSDLGHDFRVCFLICETKIIMDSDLKFVSYLVTRYAGALSRDPPTEH